MERRYRLKTFKVELVRESASDGPGARTAWDALEVLRTIFQDLDGDQEHFVVLGLDRKLRPVGFKVCHSGGMHESMVDPKIVFRSALFLGAQGIILGHNHPSGDPAPSAEDREITSTLMSGGKLLGIAVHDHIILGSRGRYFSIAQEGR